MAWCPATALSSTAASSPSWGQQLQHRRACQQRLPLWGAREWVETPHPEHFELMGSIWEAAPQGRCRCPVSPAGALGILLAPLRMGEHAAVVVRWGWQMWNIAGVNCISSAPDIALKRNDTPSRTLPHCTGMGVWALNDKAAAKLCLHIPLSSLF